MRTTLSHKTGQHCRLNSAYALMEVLVYIGLVTLVLGSAFIASYRCIDNSAVLRRNAQDIARALHVGELWRADMRRAAGEVRFVEDPGGQFLEIPSSSEERAYLFSDGTLFRRMGDGPWVRVLQGLRTCMFVHEQRASTQVWRCEMELQPREKGAVKAGRVRPLFTFIAAAPGGEAKKLNENSN